MVSPFSSNVRSSLRTACAVVCLVAAAASSGCVTVRPEDKEFLAHPAMTFGARGESDGQEAHVLGNREGTTGGSVVQGGGCGCN